MKPKDREDILDEIRDASKLGYAENVPIVDKLVDAEWCTEDDLLLAYEDLLKPDLDRVIIFFQLPFLVRLPDTWIKIKSEYGNPYIRFRPIDPDDGQKNAGVSNDPSVRDKRTQVVMSYQLWEKRRERYIPYLEALRGKEALVKTKLTSRGVLNAETFEIDVARRLLLQTFEVLKGFVPLYQITCKDPFAYTPSKLDKFFMMVKTGRIVIREHSEPRESKAVKPNKTYDYSRNLTALRTRLKLGRRPSIYETYLLETARQIELGAPNLAIVQTVMIVDWFANEIIEDHFFGEIKKSLMHAPKLHELALERMWKTKKDKRIKVSTEDKFTKYLPAIGITLTLKMRDDLGRVIKQRNEIVHHTQATAVESSAASNALNVGMAVIQHCMDCLLSSKSRGADNNTKQNAVAV